MNLLPSCFFGFILRARASASRWSSRVSNLGQTWFTKWRNLAPRLIVVVSNNSNVGSVCMRSFASPCQWAQTKSNWRISLLSSPKRPSKTGIAHCQGDNGVRRGGQMRERRQDVMNSQHTWRRSSKSRAANFLISEALEANFRIVPAPNVGTWR